MPGRPWGPHTAETRARKSEELQGEANPQSKVNEEKVLEIRRRAAEGESQAAIARDIGISPMQVSTIVRREAWRHVP